MRSNDFETGIWHPNESDYETMKIETIHNLTLINTDCMEYMKGCKDNEFDLAIVDPPYGIGNFSQSDAVHKNVNWNNSIPPDEYFAELKRVSVHRIIWGANYYNCFEGENGAIVWYKNVGHPDMSHCEIASMSKGKRVGYVHINWSGGVKTSQKIPTIHPCQKPVKLYDWLLTNYAEKGQKILDTHGGSFSSAIAAHYFGVEYVGIEIDKDYFEAGVNRVKEQTKQIDLFRQG